MNNNLYAEIINNILNNINVLCQQQSPVYGTRRAVRMHHIPCNKESSEDAPHPL